MCQLKSIVNKFYLGTYEFISIFRKWWLTVNVKTPDKGSHKREIFSEPIYNVCQENYTFLITFIHWLHEWEDVPNFSANLPRKAGKLTPQTHTAILHTTSSLILLIQYLLNHLNFKYVLLGKFQTDALENRFGKYRRMSGSNYHISVQQVLESERKLKITNLLKLKSFMQGDVSLKHFLIDFSSITGNIDRFSLDEEEEILEISGEVMLDSNTISGIIYIAGYASKKLCEKTDCNYCKKHFLTSKEMVTEFETNVEYLANLDRGGLKYPSSLSINIGFCSFQIFTVLIREKFEPKFLASSNQKYLLLQLILEKLELEESASDICNHCSQNLFYYIEKSAVTWCNILLSNYSKNITAEHSSKSTTSALSKKRKLATLNTK